MKDLSSFKEEAQIAAAYAIALGYRVTFACPGVLTELKRTGYRYLFPEVYDYEKECWVKRTP